MTQDTHIEASLLYPETKAPFEKIDLDALKALLRRLGTPVLDARQHGRDYILMDCAEIQIAIVSCDVPFELEHFQGMLRPQTDVEMRHAVLHALSQHGSSITVIVADANHVVPGQGDAGLKQLVCWESLDFLFGATGPDLLFWGTDDRLLTAPEAEAAFGDPASEAAPPEDSAPPAPQDALVKATASPFAPTPGTGEGATLGFPRRNGPAADPTHALVQTQWQDRELRSAFRIPLSGDATYADFARTRFDQLTAPLSRAIDASVTVVSPGSHLYRPVQIMVIGGLGLALAGVGLPLPTDDLLALF